MNRQWASDDRLLSSCLCSEESKMASSSLIVGGEAAETPVKQCVTVVEKKIRNLEKRKVGRGRFRRRRREKWLTDRRGSPPLTAPFWQRHSPFKTSPKELFSENFEFYFQLSLEFCVKVKQETTVSGNRRSFWDLWSPSLINDVFSKFWVILKTGRTVAPPKGTIIQITAYIKRKVTVESARLKH